MVRATDGTSSGKEGGVNLVTDLAWHGAVMELLAQRMNPTCYLEIGIAEFRTFNRVKPWCQKAYGVDPNVSGEGIFTMTSDDFARDAIRTIPKIELALIDGCHEFEQVKRDYNAVVSHSAPNVVICLHDTYPENEGQRDPLFCHDAWKMSRYLSDLGVAFVTLPCPPGLTIVGGGIL